MHHFDIKMALDCRDSQILMDGLPLSGIRAFRVECAEDQTSRIVLEIAATASITGEAQVWISDATQVQTDKADAAESRADVAETRADVAETRADIAEARADAVEAHIPGIEHGTLAYIVPVPQETRDAAEGKPRK